MRRNELSYEGPGSLICEDGTVIAAHMSVDMSDEAVPGGRAVSWHISATLPVGTAPDVARSINAVRLEGSSVPVVIKSFGLASNGITVELYGGVQQMTDEPW